MTVWLVGHGVVGRRVDRLLAHHEVRVHDPRREPTPLGEPGDVAVLTHPGRHLQLAEMFARRQISVITVGDDLDDVHGLLELGPRFSDAGRSLVIGAALSPGLSGLLARHLAERLHGVDEIHVAVHGTAGPACARAHHRSLSGRAPGLVDGRWVEFRGGAGRELCWFPEPVGPLDCYRAEIASPVLLHQAFDGVGRISVRRSATRRDRLTAPLPMLRPPHAEGGIGALRVEVRGSTADGGRETLVLGIAELVGTAAAAVAAAFVDECAQGGLPAGIVRAADAGLDTTGLLGRVEGYGVRIQAFTGQPYG
ncbi:MAG: hypothetical protein ACO3VI_10155 [Ilumatobacteraceae bacterium]|jgi:hypothetical protein